jgi:predicted nucleic acid-binding protein
MSYLVDTNVLLRSVQKTHPMQLDSTRAIDILIHHGEVVSVIPQNLIEFWAVATRPTLNNGLGLSVDETTQHIAAFKTTFELLPDVDSIFSGNNWWSGIRYPESRSTMHVLSRRCWCTTSPIC